MSKLLRLPLVLLIALAMAVLWTWPATADDPVLPTAEECLADPAPEACAPIEQLPAPEDRTGGDAGTGGGGDGAAGGAEGTAGGDEGSAGGAEGTDGGAAGGGTEGQTPAGEENPTRSPADGDTYTPGGWVSGPEAAAALAIICDDDDATVIPDCPAEGEEPLPPLTCEDLGELLGQDGCPDSFTCEELAELLGIEGCPEGPPTCEDLAALFGLEGCPEEPPGNCEDFAALLGLEDCEQIPCLDISQLPAEAKEGLAPLLEGLEQIGVTACEEEETPTGGGQKPPTNNPPSGVQGTHYENCDDARAKGAAPVYSNQPGYRAGLDSDNDGIGCEDDTYVTPVNTTTPTTGTLAYTGIDLEPMLRGIAILLSSGTLLLLAGLRRT